MPFLNLRSNCRWLYFLERTSCTHQWSDWKTSASWYVSFHLSVLISSAFRNSQGRGAHKLSSKSQKEHFICQQDVLLQAHVCFSAIFPACFLFCSILNIDSYTILFWFCMHRTKDLNKSQIFPDFLYTVQDFRDKSKEANNPNGGMEILLQGSTLNFLIFTLLSLEWDAFFVL